MKNINLELAIEKMRNENLTSVLLNGKEIYSSSERGIKFLRSLVIDEKNLTGFSAADKVVGKAAAYLFVKLNVSELYTEIISEAAAGVFEKYGLRYSFDKIVPNIINRKGDDICPMEKTVLEISELDEAIELLLNKQI